MSGPGQDVRYALRQLRRNPGFEVRPTDPVTFAGGILFLASIAMLASYIPGRRAAKVDPVEALRYE